MKKTKFLIITNHSYMLWQFRRELIEELLTQGEVVISVPFGDHVSDFEALGCRMINTKLDRRGINPVKDIGLYRSYRKLLKQERPDMVITYSIKPNVYGGYACRRLKIPYCVNVQGLGTAFQKKGLATLVKYMYKIALKKSKVTFFENQGNADLFVERNIIKPENLCLLNGAGVNLKRYPFTPYPQNQKLHFLYLGRIMREKGIDELFAAAKSLKAQGVDFVLDLVGFFEDEYKTAVEQLSSEGIAVFHGFQQNPIPYYQNADCVVLPSYHEGMSNVLLEASAIGRPVITSDIYGCREAVVPNESGYLCTVKSAESLAEAMGKFARLTPEQRSAMGAKARTHMEQNFEKSIIVQKTVKEILK